MLVSNRGINSAISASLIAEHSIIDLSNRTQENIVVEISDYGLAES